MLQYAHENHLMPLRMGIHISQENLYTHLLILMDLRTLYTDALPWTALHYWMFPLQVIEKHQKVLWNFKRKSIYHFINCQCKLSVFVGVFSMNGFIQCRMNSKLSLLILKLSLNSSLDQYCNYLTKKIIIISITVFHSWFSFIWKPLLLVHLNKEMWQLHHLDDLWVKTIQMFHCYKTLCLIFFVFIFHSYFLPYYYRTKQLIQ